MLFEEIYTDIMSSFNSVWSFKERGNTLEIVTPFVTTLNSFVSVFITKRGDDYIIADGGWLNSGDYDINLEFEEHCFTKVFYHYEAAFEVKSVYNAGGTVYYKKTGDPAMIPSMVMDLGLFISTIVSASAISFTDEAERETRRVFHSKAKAYLMEQYRDSIQWNATLDDIKSIRFNSIINKRNRLSLLSFATGYSPNDFNNSIFKAFYNFQFSFKSKLKDQVANRITLIDNEAHGYAPAKVSDHIENLKSLGVTAITWSEKEKLKELV